MLKGYTIWDDDLPIGENNPPVAPIGSVREQMDPVDIKVTPARKVRRRKAIPQSDMARKFKRYGMTPREVAQWRREHAKR